MGNEELTEKRCLSMQRCPQLAMQYYGKSNLFNSTIDGGIINTKGLCASWAESFAYADKALEYGDNIARNHRDAREIVSKDYKLQKECRQIALELANCLRTTKKKS